MDTSLRVGLVINVLYYLRDKGNHFFCYFFGVGCAEGVRRWRVEGMLFYDLPMTFFATTDATKDTFSS